MARAISRALLASRPVRVLILILALTLILVGAALFSNWSGLEQFVALSSHGMRVLWLPLVLLLAMVIVGVIWALWRLAREERRISQFPDIDWAWDEAALSMRKNGIGLDRVPLFLVVGEPSNGIDSLFQASRLSFVISGLPRRPDAPIRVYATRDAIFVACPGVSLLSRLGSEMSARSHPQSDPAVGRGESLQREEPLSLPAPALAGALPSLSEPRELSSPATTTSALDLPGSPPATTTAPRPSVLSRTEEVESLDDRLRHLCSLIVRDRRPYCPVNGILALIPFAGTDDDTRARQVGTACHLDLTAARTTLGISCPTFSLLCDLENANGFARLIRSYASEPGYRLIGRSFPLVPDMDIPERVQMVATGMEWICQGLIAPMVYRLFQLESVSRDEGGRSLESNAELIRFLSDTHERWRRLGRILGRVISLDSQGDLMLGGCYLAATGETESQQGFVTGLTRTLLEHQNFVAWTTEMLRRDRAESRIAALCNLGSLGVTALAVVAAYLFWGRNP